MRIDFPQLEAINAKARRERAEAVYWLIILPIKRFFSNATRTPLPPQGKGGRAAA